MGLQDVGVVFVLLPKETLEFIVVSFLGIGEGPVKSEGISGDASRKEMRAGSGVRAIQFESVKTASDCGRKSSTSVRPVKDGGRRHEWLGAGAGAVIVNNTEWF